MHRALRLARNVIDMRVRLLHLVEKHPEMVVIVFSAWDACIETLHVLVHASTGGSSRAPRRWIQDNANNVPNTLAVA